MERSLLRTWLFAVVSLLAVVVAGCQREVAPPLVQAVDVSPREVEVGDRIEIRGTGFPQGRVAKVTFRGVLRKPGARASEDSITVDGLVVNTERVEVFVNEALEEKFCGHGDQALHTTFSGAVDVAFASSTPGAPPLVGTFPFASLDVRPSSVRAATHVDRVAEGRRILTFLGITPGPEAARGLPIEQVAPGSPAEKAGLTAGDVLTAADGVHVLGLADVAATSARSIRLSVRHADAGSDDERTLSLVGYATDRIPVEYAPALVVIGLALAVLALIVLPGPLALGVLEAKIAYRARTLTVRRAVARLFGRGLVLLVALATTLVVATFALGPFVFGPDIDGAVLFIVALGLLTASRGMGQPSLVGAFRVALQVGACALVVGASLAAVVVVNGAIQLGELVHHQGGTPWEFAAARNPSTAIAAIVYFGGLLTILRVRARSEILERLGLFVASALGVAVFFGGWQLPGVTTPLPLALQFVGAALFVLKAWAAHALVVGSASMTSSLDGRGARSFAVRRLSPALAAAAFLGLAVRHMPSNASVELGIGATVVATVLLLAVRSALRVRGALGRPAPHVSPFL